MMSRTILFVLALTLPLSAFAQTVTTPFSVGRSLVVASSSPGNAYFAGMSLVHTGVVGGDLFSIAGSVLSTGAVRRDLLLLGGSLRSQGAVAGDFRAVGGSVSSEAPVEGDFIAGGFSVDSSAHVGGDVFVVGADVVFSGGADGAVTIYGNTVSLGGTFTEDVHVVATTRLSIEKDTDMQGTLTYTAPEEALVPTNAQIGHIEYTSASYFSDVGTSRVLSGVSIAIFILVRILGALILAGLFAGLFPKIGEAMVQRLYTERPRSILLATLLGFAILVATPVLIVILLLTFVGIGLAALLLVLYALLAMLSVLYSGVLLGGLFARRFMKREAIRWHDGILGMLALSLIMFVPVGAFAAFLLMMFTSGSLLQSFFHFAFPREV